MNTLQMEIFVHLTLVSIWRHTNNSRLSPRCAAEFAISPTIHVGFATATPKRQSSIFHRIRAVTNRNL